MGDDRGGERKGRAMGYGSEHLNGLRVEEVSLREEIAAADARVCCFWHEKEYGHGRSCGHGLRVLGEADLLLF